MANGGTMLGALVVGVLFLVGGVVFYALRNRGAGGGLASLAERFAASAEPEGHRLARQSAKIGSAQFRNCVTITIAPEGLWLHVFDLATGRPPLLIPWDQISDVRETTFHGRKAARLAVGRPTVAAITIYWEVFHSMRSQLVAAV